MKPPGRKADRNRSLVGAWLGPRLAKGPAELAAEIRRAVDRIADRAPDGAPLSELLAHAAAALLEELSETCRDRRCAVPLLAADVCLAYAFEAAAEAGEAIEEVADRWGVRGRLGPLLERRLREGEP